MFRSRILLTRLPLLALSCLLASGALCGCRRFAERRTIVVIPHRMSGPLWLSEHVGLGEAAERDGFELSWSGPNDDASIDEQYALAEQAIHRGAAGIILSPNADRVFKRVVMDASERHIPVVIEGEAAGLEPMPGVSFVLGNKKKEGQIIADRLGEVLGHHGNILLVGLDPHVPGIVERSDAIAEALQRTEPDIHVIDRVFGSNSPVHSEALILQALAAHPDVRGLVSLSSDESLAAASAVHNLPSAKGMEIIGCDQSKAVFVLLHMGLLDVLVIEDNRREGALAVDTIRDMRAGIYASRSVVVDPAVVTRDNVRTEAMQQLLLMHR